ncbi:hypothetical protein BDB01DRAFT_803131 [Pilobolus umbonatus]|nr:hypothetical protein BDB01DRAFT_803131 [Pilobolus umbonatus]
MRSVLSLAIAGLLALSVNAASINKRTVSPEVQTCVDKLNLIGPQLAVVKTAVDGFVRTQGYAVALSIHNKGLALNTKITDARTACCVDTGAVITDDEAVAVLTVVQGISPNIQATLGSVVAKKPEFDAVALATNILKNDITTLDASTDALIACLIGRTPTTYTDAANAEKAIIDGAFDAAKAAYA